MILSTPLELASESMRNPTCASLTRTFDTFRILEETMDFSDIHGSGWRVFRNVRPLPGFLAKRDLEPEAALLLGMIKLSSFELTTYGFGIELAGMLASCLHPVSDESCDLLLHIGGADIINCPLDCLIYIGGGYPILHWHLIHFRIAEGLSQVLSKGPDLFRSGFNGTISPRKETPTSLAMYTSWAFERWRDVLISFGVDVENFVKLELEKNQLVHTGWTTPTLLHLFSCDHSEYEPMQDIWDCSDCAAELHATEMYSLIVQPHWRHRLERIRQGLDPDLPVQDDSEANDTELTGLATLTDTLGSPYELADETYGIGDDALDSGTLSPSATDPELGFWSFRESPHRYPRMVSLLADCVYDRHEIICMNCWRHFVWSGTRRQPSWKRDFPAWLISNPSPIGSMEDEASEDEFSPYLIHT